MSNQQWVKLKPSDTKLSKRKSSPSPDIKGKPSPKKSAVFLVAGTKEDDWMPETVASADSSDVIKEVGHFYLTCLVYEEGTRSGCRTPQA